MLGFVLSDLTACENPDNGVWTHHPERRETPVQGFLSTIDQKALASAVPARASTVLCGSSTGSSTGVAGSCLIDELLEDAGGFGLHAGEHVLVGVNSERRVPVTQPL